MACSSAAFMARWCSVHRLWPMVPSEQIVLWRNCYWGYVYLWLKCDVEWNRLMPWWESWFEFDWAPALPTYLKCFGLSILSALICYMVSFQGREGECGPCNGSINLNAVSCIWELRQGVGRWVNAWVDKWKGLFQHMNEMVWCLVQRVGLNPI